MPENFSRTPPPSDRHPCPFLPAELHRANPALFPVGKVVFVNV
nr:MAG TPA: hypothetical protein [Caudoviricetes sp.]